MSTILGYAKIPRSPRDLADKKIFGYNACFDLAILPQWNSINFSGIGHLRDLYMVNSKNKGYREIWRNRLRNIVYNKLFDDFQKLKGRKISSWLQILLSGFLMLMNSISFYFQMTLSTDLHFAFSMLKLSLFGGSDFSLENLIDTYHVEDPERPLVQNKSFFCSRLNCL